MNRFVLAVIACCLVLASCSPVWALQWKYENVATIGTTANNSIAVDAAGKPYIAIENWSTDCVEYAYKDGAVWKTETVDGPSEHFYHTSLAMDPNGNPHISYHKDYAGGGLKYANKTSSGWAVEMVDQTDWDGFANSMQTDSSGNPHIAYGNYLSGPVKYASRVGNSWTIEIVDAARNLADEACSLALDKNDNPVMAYRGSNGELKIARKVGSTWSIETIDTACDYMSLRLDINGNPHLSYRWVNSSNQRILKYAYWNGATWTKEVVDSSTVKTGYCSSMVLDSKGRPYIVYYEDMNYDVKIAYRKGSTWTKEVLNTNGLYPSLAIDGSDRLHMSFYAYSQLMYATAAVPEPSSLLTLVCGLSGVGGMLWRRRR